jgi:hypothetical protein
VAHLFVSNRQRLIDSGYAAIADVPVLFNDQHKYFREPNRFLRERALGEWFPSAGAASKSGSAERASVASYSLK